MRSFAVDAGTMWVLTAPFDSTSLLLTELPAGGGDSTTIELDSAVNHMTGTGLAPDGDGHLWITYGDQIVRLTASSLSIERWSIPSTAADTADTQLMRPLTADAWDSATGQLLFVRYDDRVLYTFDPQSGRAQPLRDLPIVTSPLTQLILSDGILAITGGTPGSQQFAPMAAVISLETGSTSLVPDVIGVATAGQRIVSLESGGAVADLTLSGVSPSTLSQGSIGRPLIGSDSAGNTFVVSFAPGSVRLARIDPQGQASHFTVPLVAAGERQVHEGINPATPTWLDPRPVGIVGDERGGAWLVTESGTQGVSLDSPQYASLVHIAFPQG